MRTDPIWAYGGGSLSNVPKAIETASHAATPTELGTSESMRGERVQVAPLHTKSVPIKNRPHIARVSWGKKLSQRQLQEQQGERSRAQESPAQHLEQRGK